MARPKKSIDPKQVERLARYGSPIEEIATALNCSADTLGRRYAEPIKRGKEKLCFTIRKTLLRKAFEGDTACLIFVSKCIAGLKEPRDDAVNVQVNTIAAAGNTFAVSDQAKKHFADIAQLVRREAALQVNNNNSENG